MAGSLSNFNFDVKTSWEFAEDLTISTSVNSGSRILSGDLENGTLANQANRVYAVRGSINPSSSATIDLKALTDFFNYSFEFDTLRVVYVELESTSQASSILVGAAGVQTPSAPSLSLSVGAGSLAAGDYDVCVSYTTSGGETMVGPVSTITAALNDRIVVGAVTLPTGATGRKFYMSLVVNANALALHGSGTGSAYNIDAVPTTTAATIPFSSTAHTAVSSLFGGSSHQVRVRNGGCALLSCASDSTAYSVGSSTNNIRILNEDSTYQASYVLILAGSDT